VAVLGAGNGGLAMAADLALAGHRVRLYNRSPGRLEPIIGTGGIELEGKAPRLVRLDRVTAEPGEAVQGASLIMVVVPATGHATLAEIFAPHLQDGQVVVLNPGRTGGALEFQSILRTNGAAPGAIVAEASTFLFASRATGPARARIYGRKSRVLFSALPASANREVGWLLDQLYPGRFVAASSVLETSLDNIGAVFHPAITLLNTGRIEDTADGFEFYRRGASPSVAKVMAAVDQERCTIAATLGVPHQSALSWMDKTYGIKAPDLYSALQANPGYAGITAPGQLDHRYLTEDVPASLVPMASLGAALRVPTPNIRCLIDLASTIHGLDYMAIGRTIERLGLSGHTPGQILAHVAEGRAVA
jgi:opine dehydrogenase